LTNTPNSTTNNIGNFIFFGFDHLAFIE
jgi:hypothetical protein